MAKVCLSPRATRWADRLRHCQAGAVSVMFAAGAIPMIGLVGLAVDFGIWNQTNATLSVAANVAAMTAVRIAANAQVANDSNPPLEGQVAGQQWFASEVGLNGKVGTLGVQLSGGTFGANVSVTGGPTVKATVSYSGYVPSVFGFAMFGFTRYPISGQAVAVVTTAPYLNVYMMLDDSSSMQIGATDADIKTMQEITPCYSVPSLSGSLAPGAFYPTGPKGSIYNSGNLQDQSYGAYATSGYTGTLQTPAVAPDPPLTYSTYVVGSNNDLSGNNITNNQTCSGQQTPPGAQPTYYDKNYNPPQNFPVLAGPPCAFACHFDSAPAGTGNDFYGLARSTIGQSNQVTLRFDLVKQATDNVINAMQTDNISSINNLQVGIYSFSTQTTRAYPDPSCGSGQTCEAGGDWATATADVGGPASYPNGPDTGIKPSYTPTHPAGVGDTNFDADMTQLQGMLTPSSTGVDAQHPRKVLFIVTDGMCDGTCGGSVSRTYLPMNPADCAVFKNAPYNYTVYVVYTQYYPLMNQFYISNLKQYAEPKTGSPLYTAMQACASSPDDFISASDAKTLNAALQTFLKQALNSPSRFTQ